MNQMTQWQWAARVMQKGARFLLVPGFFIGLWHGFPLVTIVNDEMYYAGGVLRAMQDHSVLPRPGDVPYGTLTYMLSYAGIGLYLGCALALYNWDISALRSELIEKPYLVYLPPRILSAAQGLFTLALVSRLLKDEIEEEWGRVYIIILLYTNVLVTLVFHTAKVHVLSTVLAFLSFYNLYTGTTKILSTEEPSGRTRLRMSIVLAFLATANLPLYAFTLINIPLMLFFLPNRRKTLTILMTSCSMGLILFLMVISTNLTDVVNQVMSIFQEYRPSGQMSVWRSFLHHSAKITAAYPFLLGTLIIGLWKGIRRPMLFWMASSYVIAYVAVLSITVTWATWETYVRYIFPVSFFLVFAVAGCEMVKRRVALVFATSSIAFYVWLLYLLAVPTTYNDAYDWILKSLNRGSVVLVNNVKELELPMNGKTAVLIDERFCGSRCKYAMTHAVNEWFRPLVIDRRSRSVPNLGKDTEMYFIQEQRWRGKGQELVAMMEGGGGQKRYLSVDYNMGFYRVGDLLGVRRLGKNVYIYRCDMEHGRRESQSQR